MIILLDFVGRKKTYQTQIIIIQRRLFFFILKHVWRGCEAGRSPCPSNSTTLISNAGFLLKISAPDRCCWPRYKMDLYHVAFVPSETVTLK